MASVVRKRRRRDQVHFVRYRGRAINDANGKSADSDWGDVRFRSRRTRYAEGTPEDNATARFVIGILVFLVVALLYPWYSYWVQSRLVARDLEKAAAAVETQLRREVSGINEHIQRTPLAGRRWPIAAASLQCRS